MPFFLRERDCLRSIVSSLHPNIANPRIGRRGDPFTGFLFRRLDDQAVDGAGKPATVRVRRVVSTISLLGSTA